MIDIVGMSSRFLRNPHHLASFAPVLYLLCSYCGARGLCGRNSRSRRVDRGTRTRRRIGGTACRSGSNNRWRGAMSVEEFARSGTSAPNIRQGRCWGDAHLREGHRVLLPGHILHRRLVCSHRHPTTRRRSRDGVPANRSNATAHVRGNTPTSEVVRRGSDWRPS